MVCLQHRRRRHRCGGSPAFVWCAPAVGAGGIKKPVSRGQVASEPARNRAQVQDMKQLFSLTAALAVFSAAFAAAPANAQTFRELMEDIGVQKREQPKIDFSERAPLVLPPDEQALPPPEDASALAGVNPNWPRDVD